MSNSDRRYRVELYPRCMNIIDFVTLQRHNWNIFAIILLVRPGLSLNRPRGSSARCQMQIPCVPTSARNCHSIQGIRSANKYAYAHLISKDEIFGTINYLNKLTFLRRTFAISIIVKKKVLFIRYFVARVI